MSQNNDQDIFFETDPQRNAMLGFANKVVRSFDEYVDNRLFKAMKSEVNASVPVTQIIGVRHPSYHGGTWRTVLSNLNRGTSALIQAQDNPGYYLDRNPKKDWSFYKTPEGYYVDEGCHRSVIAKFLYANNGANVLCGEEIHGVTVYEVIPDTDAERTIKYLRSSLRSIDRFRHIEIKIHQDAGHHYLGQQKYFIYNPKRTSYEEYSIAQLEQLCVKIRSLRSWQILFGFGLPPEIK